MKSANRSGNVARIRHFQVLARSHHAVLEHPVVVDVERRMLKPPDPRVMAHGSPQIGKVFQQVNMIEQRICEPFGGPRMAPPRPTHDLDEVC